jgi:hypothetical protein
MVVWGRFQQRALSETALFVVNVALCLYLSSTPFFIRGEEIATEFYAEGPPIHCKDFSSDPTVSSWVQVKVLHALSTDPLCPDTKLDVPALLGASPKGGFCSAIQECGAANSASPAMNGSTPPAPTFPAPPPLPHPPPPRAPSSPSPLIAPPWGGCLDGPEVLRLVSWLLWPRAACSLATHMAANFLLCSCNTPSHARLLSREFLLPAA